MSETEAIRNHSQRTEALDEVRAELLRAISRELESPDEIGGEGVRVRNFAEAYRILGDTTNSSDSNLVSMQAHGRLVAAARRAVAAYMADADIESVVADLERLTGGQQE
jgi:hypothetical protein